MKNFKDFVLESSKGPDLHYYAFDVDDNLVHMNTKVLMDKKDGDDWIPYDASTSEFASIRNDKENWRLRDNNPDKAFSEFRDLGSRGNLSFLGDLKSSILSGNTGPSWEAFMKCLTDGSIFAIITARGHEPDSIKIGVEWIIDNVLSKDDQYSLYNNCLKHDYLFDSSREDYDRIPKGKVSQTPLIQDYLKSCDFYGVSSNSFAKEFGQSSASNPEKAKEMALDVFINKCKKFGEKIGSSVSVGFSDDDPRTVDHIHKYFKDKSSDGSVSNLKLNLYKTTDRTKNGGERKRFTKGIEESSNQSIGMEGSIIPFSQYNSMSSRLFPSNDMESDPSKVVMNLALDHIDKFDFIRKTPKSKTKKKTSKSKTKKKNLKS